MQCHCISATSLVPMWGCQLTPSISARALRLMLAVCWPTSTGREPRLHQPNSAESRTQSNSTGCGGVACACWPRGKTGLGCGPWATWHTWSCASYTAGAVLRNSMGRLEAAQGGFRGLLTCTGYTIQALNK